MLAPKSAAHRAVVVPFSSSERSYMQQAALTSSAWPARLAWHRQSLAPQSEQHWQSLVPFISHSPTQGWGSCAWYGFDASQISALSAALYQ